MLANQQIEFLTWRLKLSEVFHDWRLTNITPNVREHDEVRS